MAVDSWLEQHDQQIAASDESERDGLSDSTEHLDSQSIGPRDYALEGMVARDCCENMR